MHKDTSDAQNESKHCHCCMSLQKHYLTSCFHTSSHPRLQPSTQDPKLRRSTWTGPDKRANASAQGQRAARRHCQLHQRSQFPRQERHQRTGVVTQQLPSTLPHPFLSVSLFFFLSPSVFLSFSLFLVEVMPLHAKLSRTISGRIAQYHEEGVVKNKPWFLFIY